MPSFERRLERVLSEMAELAGWHPTRRQRYLVSFDGQEEDVAYGDSPQAAIKDFLSHLDGGQTAADGHSIPLQIYLAGLTAELEDESHESFTDFRTRDIKLINAQKTRRTIETWLNNNPTPYRFIIHFGDASPQPTPGVITYIKSGNAGGDALTPHMVLHTLGHALVEYDTDVAEPIGNILYGQSPSDEDDLLIPICKLLHMKAAEFTIQGDNRGFPAFTELLYEVMAIYVKNGRIKIAPNKYCDYTITPEQCAMISNALAEFCKHRLDLAVGRIVWDE